ncbi:hypothetical protein F4861DRAFT_286306 [Xylaria intraflava]|nr:hypothetical protein F4861DRAFT_286306 [Xylaria intraflava]
MAKSAHVLHVVLLMTGEKMVWSCPRRSPVTFFFFFGLLILPHSVPTPTSRSSESRRYKLNAPQLESSHTDYVSMERYFVPETKLVLPQRRPLFVRSNESVRVQQDKQMLRRRSQICRCTLACAAVDMRRSLCVCV